jgi:hypothetical protein
MVRKLKTYRTSIGFYDLTVAASRAGDLEPTATSSIKDPPSRPVGTDGAFKETSKLPKVPAGAKAATTPRKHPLCLAKAVKTDDAAARRAAEVFDRDQQSAKRRSAGMK